VLFQRLCQNLKRKKATEKGQTKAAQIRLAQMLLVHRLPKRGC
jgi:hypothetical protein